MAWDGSGGLVFLYRKHLLNYPDETLQPLVYLSAHVIKGKLKLLDTYPKSEEITHFIPYFYTLAAFCSDFVQQNCHILVNKLLHLKTSIILANTYNGRNRNL